MANDSLLSARKYKKDNFYTLYEYIENELEAYISFNPDVFRGKTILLPCDNPEHSNFTKYFIVNFERLGIKKLISSVLSDSQISPRGRILIIDTPPNSFNPSWSVLEGNGDFRSEEIQYYRDEADIIITNPPFSLFREFIKWVTDANKLFIVLGLTTVATYNDIFEQIRKGNLWVGATNYGKDMVFQVPKGYPVNPKDKKRAEYLGYVGDFTRLGNVCWYTNIDHGRKFQFLSLKTMEENIKSSNHSDIRTNGYRRYFNFDGIDVPYIDAIPSDYTGIMGVPHNFLNVYNPNQFELLYKDSSAPKKFIHKTEKDAIYFVDPLTGEVVYEMPYTLTERKIGNGLRLDDNGTPGSQPYDRVLIRHRK